MVAVPSSELRKDLNLPYGRQTPNATRTITLLASTVPPVGGYGSQQHSARAMFSLVAGAYEAWTRQRTYNVLILGLDGAGKTVALTQCARDSIAPII